jgi:putative PIN family toxin of toxin-antitoxin system
VRLVLDTNVLLAGIATHGICEAIVAISYRDHSVVLSEYILSELREHYIGKFKATDEQAAIVVTILRSQSQIVVPAPVSPEAFSDADDLPVLGIAISGHAECLVTGDKQLQELKEYQGVKIVSPRGLYDLLRITE